MNIQTNENKLHGIGIPNTCHNENKHALALEGDKDIFDNVLKPLVNECPNDGFDEQRGNPNPMFLDDNDIGLIEDQGP